MPVNVLIDNQCDIILKRSACLVAFQYLPRYITEPGNGRSSFNVQTYKFSSSFFFILLLVTLQTYIWQKKLGIANWPIEGKKQYVFARQLPHTKTYI